MRYLSHPLIGKNVLAKFVERKLDYIHENASKAEAKLVENPEDYEYCWVDPTKIRTTSEGPKLRTSQQRRLRRNKGKPKC